MFDIARLQEILVQYKKEFADYVWNNERYKWIAVQNFQDNWDVSNAELPWSSSLMLCIRI